jgi:hypothetical protein
VAFELAKLCWAWRGTFRPARPPKTESQVQAHPAQGVPVKWYASLIRASCQVHHWALAPGLACSTDGLGLMAKCDTLSFFSRSNRTAWHPVKPIASGDATQREQGSEAAKHRKAI